MDEVNSSGGGGVRRRDSWHGDMGRKPRQGINDTFSRGLGDPDSVAAVVASGRAKVPTVNSMWSPSAAHGRLFMNENAGAWRSQGSAVEVEEAVDLRPSGKLRIDARTAEKVQRLEGLREEAIPKVERKGRVGAAEASNEVVLEGANGLLCSVASMDMRWCELEIDGIVGHELLKSGGRFVVETLEEWAEATGGEEGVGTLVGSQDLSAGLALHRLDMDVVAVVVVED
jgi:hypothetical protein